MGGGVNSVPPKDAEVLTPPRSGEGDLSERVSLQGRQVKAGPTDTGEAFPKERSAEHHPSRFSTLGVLRSHEFEKHCWLAPSPSRPGMAHVGSNEP